MIPKWTRSADLTHPLAAASLCGWAPHPELQAERPPCKRPSKPSPPIARPAHKPSSSQAV
eukprot:3842913-Alexandrium_andersonii.AAC.1